MLENQNPTDTSSTAPVKRYAPPNQRNRGGLGRRKSGGDRLERAGSYGNDGEKNQPLRNVPIMEHAEPPRLIGLQGCSNSEAYQLLNNRWAAAINAYESPSTDLAERPVMYSGSSASAWGPIRLPHQMFSPMAGVGSSGPQMDFISELRQAMHNSNAQF